MTRQTKWVDLVILSLFFSVNLYAQQLDSTGASSGSAPAILSSGVNMISGAADGAVPRLIKVSGVINAQMTGAARTALRETGDGGTSRIIGVTFCLYPLPADGAPL